MSGKTSRRALMRAIAAAALLPAFAQSAGAAAKSRGGPIVPPKAPMLFSRRLTRELSGGYAIVAERRFEVRFERLGNGFRIDGKQVAVSVDAPPNLAAYVRLEQQRTEAGMFPIMLDSHGLIRSDPEVTSHATLDRAVALALAQVEKMKLSDADKSEARSFLLSLEQAADKISSEPPANLFTPPPAPERLTREVALPGGLSGSISTQFSGSTAPETGLLERAERIVLTGTAGTTRRTLEHWRLDELDGRSFS